MNWIVRATNFRTGLIVLMGFGAVTPVFAGSSLSVPVAGGTVPFGAVPTVAVLSLAPIILIGWRFDLVTPPFTDASVRNRDGYLSIVGLAAVLGYGVTAFLVSVALNLPDAQVAARNALIYFGIFQLAAMFFGYRYAAMAPVIYLLASSIFGRAGSGIQPWAWPLVEGEHLGMLLLSGAVTLIGITSIFIDRAKSRY